MRFARHQLDAETSNEEEVFWRTVKVFEKPDASFLAPPSASSHCAVCASTSYSASCSCVSSCLPPPEATRSRWGGMTDPTEAGGYGAPWAPSRGPTPS